MWYIIILDLVSSYTIQIHSGTGFGLVVLDGGLILLGIIPDPGAGWDFQNKGSCFRKIKPGDFWEHRDPTFSFCFLTSCLIFLAHSAPPSLLHASQDSALFEKGD